MENPNKPQETSFKLAALNAAISLASIRLQAQSSLQRTQPMDVDTILADATKFNDWLNDFEMKRL